MTDVTIRTAFSTGLKNIHVVYLRPNKDYEIWESEGGCYWVSRPKRQDLGPRGWSVWRIGRKDPIYAVTFRTLEYALQILSAYLDNFELEERVNQSIAELSPFERRSRVIQL